MYFGKVVAYERWSQREVRLYFRHKTEEMPDISDKAAAYHPPKHKSQREQDYFEMLIFLNIEENKPFHSIFRNVPGHYFCSYNAIDKQVCQ